MWWAGDGGPCAYVYGVTRLSDHARQYSTSPPFSLASSLNPPSLPPSPEVCEPLRHGRKEGRKKGGREDKVASHFSSLTPRRFLPSTGFFMSYSHGYVTNTLEFWLGHISKYLSRTLIVFTFKSSFTDESF